MKKRAIRLLSMLLALLMLTGCSSSILNDPLDRAYRALQRSFISAGRNLVPFDEMEYHPHQFVSMVENGRIEELLSSKGIYTCLSCFACVERCPRNVEPAKLIEAVRNAVQRQQGMDHLKPERIPEILDEELPQQAIAAAFRKYKK